MGERVELAAEVAVAPEEMVAVAEEMEQREPPLGAECRQPTRFSPMEFSARGLQ